MLTLETKTLVEELTGREIFDFLANPSDREYQHWWPGVHLGLHTLSRADGHVGDVVFMNEYVGARGVRLLGIVVEAVAGKRLVWQLQAGLRLPVWLSLDFADTTDGVWCDDHPSHSRGLGRLGPDSRPALSALLLSQLRRRAGYARTDRAPPLRGTASRGTSHEGHEELERVRRRCAAEPARAGDTRMTTRRLDPTRSDLVHRLRDARGRRVAFLAHCLLNENTRYLGGACRAGCIQEILAQCVDLGLGIVQLPCPEELAWGGVLKRHLLRSYGSAIAHPLAWRLGRPLLPVALAHTRHVYRRIARRVAAQIADYAASGIDVIAVVGVDGSPSCGVDTTLDPAACLDEIARTPAASMTVEQQNALIRQLTRSGRGLFVAALRRELSRRHLEVPFVGHDLLRELAGSPSNVDVAAIARRSVTRRRNGRARREPCR